jgi:glycosyltransferase involved in cell wall biosynthesis
MNFPKLSIITPSFNRAEMIAAAIESVLLQNYPNFEHIIVDGGSTDNTLDVLAKYPHLKVMSQPDQGIYDALNKGIGIARGEYIGFLNTDDYYVEGAFSEVVNLFERMHSDAIAGRAQLFRQMRDGTNSVIHLTKLLTEQRLWAELTYGDPAFNAWFFRRRVFAQIGNFDTSYRIIADRDFLIRFALSDLPHTHLEKVIYCYRVHDNSLTFSRNISGFSRIADENLRWAGYYLDLIPKRARFEMQRVRTRDTITAASCELRVGSYQRALHYMQLGCRYDLFWPIKFLWRLFTGIFRVIGRRLGVYPPI